MAGKAIRSIEEKDRSRQDKEKQDREEKKVQVIRDYINQTSPGSAPDPILRRLPNGQMTEIVGKYSAESREELADQLSAAISGEKDLHDLIVEQHTMKLKQAAADMESDRIKLLSTGSSLTQGENGSRVIGGKEQADELIKRLQLMRESNRSQIARRMMGQDPDQSDSDDNSD